MSLLKRAVSLEREAVDTVRKFGKRNVFTESMMTVTGVEQNDPDAMEAVSTLGPILISRLRHIAPDVLEGPSNYNFADPMADEMHHVAVSLDEASRRTRIVLEDSYHCDFETAVLKATRAVTTAIQGQTASPFHRANVRVVTSFGQA